MRSTLHNPVAVTLAIVLGVITLLVAVNAVAGAMQGIDPGFVATGTTTTTQAITRTAEALTATTPAATTPVMTTTSQAAARPSPDGYLSAVK